MVVDPQFLAARGIPNRSKKPVVATLSVRAAFDDGWAAAKGRYGLVLGTVVIVGMLTLGAGMAGGLIDAVLFPSPAGASSGEVLFTPFTWLAHIVVGGPLFAGATLMGARLVRGEHVELATAFVGFGRIIHVASIAVIVQLATWIMWLGIFTAGEAMQQSGVPLSLGIAAAVGGVCVMVFVMARVAMATTVCLDERVGRPGIVESIAFSWRMTGRWRWLRLILIYICLGMIFAICFLLLVIPAIVFAAPLMLGVWGAAYAQCVAGYERRFGPGRCRHCGYDLHGLAPGPCPECGAVPA